VATERHPERTTRMLFMGDDSLADGFRLIGFETFPNPEPAEVDKLFRSLVKNGERAFVIVDNGLMNTDIPSLQRVRAEGGRIIVAAVPRLHEAPRLASDVADRLSAMFGSAIQPHAD
jgi:vacuolar-type H+-ATPase subunit F/Vma7